MLKKISLLCATIGRLYLPELDTANRQSVLLGVIGVLILFFGVISLDIIFSPPLVSADEPLHLSYIWSIYNGSLPSFFHAPRLPFTGIALPPVQWVAQHPPLFYILLAPFVGSLLAAHHAVLAIVIGRYMSALFGTVTILAVPFFLNRWGIKSRSQLIASALLTATAVRFIGINGAIYNDSLGILLSTLSIGLMGIIFINGPTKKRLSYMAIVLSLGMLTRAFLAVNVLLGCLTIIIAYYIHSRENRFRAVVKGMLIAISFGFITALVSGWYYLRNYTLTGSLLGGSQDWAMQHLGRMHYSISQAWHIPGFSQLLFHLYDDTNSRIAAFISLLLYLASFVVIFKLIRDRSRNHFLLALFSVFMLGYVILTYALLLLYVSSGGGLNTRYLLEALLPLVFLLSLCLLDIGLVGIIFITTLAMFGVINTLNNLFKATGGAIKMVSHGSLSFPIGPVEAHIIFIILCSLIGIGGGFIGLGILGKKYPKSSIEN